MDRQYNGQKKKCGKKPNNGTQNITQISNVFEQHEPTNNQRQWKAVPDP